MWQFPYGYNFSPRPDQELWSALLEYALDHGGNFPAGEATPEASLSLLYPKYADANLLRGQSVPLAVVQAILDQGERLGPDTCGWHYVEGLRWDDDPRLALFWDKAGLDYSGRRRPYGGHWVVFVTGVPESINGARWETFLEEQKELLAKLLSLKRQTP
jgi:hypothetical protein